MYDVKTILFTTDFSECSRHAFPVADKLAGVLGARLILLHVIDPRIQAAEMSVIIPITQPALDQLVKRLEDFTCESPDLKVDRLVTQGDIVDEILRVAREEHCGLIVMGTHGRKGLGRALLGSETENVLRRASCPVLAVRGELDLEAIPGHEPAAVGAT
jgi:nucleotide-binding universal stress UspA family protein